MSLGTALRERIGVRDDVALIELGTVDGYLTSATIAELTAAIREADAQGSEMLVLYTDGPDLCLGRRPQQGGEMSRLEQLQAIVEFNRALHEFSGISVTVARGRAQGFGFGVCIGADICVADDGATFQFDEVEHGLSPLVVVEYLAEAFNWRQVVNLTALGDIVSADDTEQFGFRRARGGTLVEEVAAIVGKFDATRVGATKLIKNYYRALPQGSRSANFGYDAIARLDLWLSARAKQQ